MILLQLITQHEVLAVVARGQSVILTNHSNSERPYLSKVLQKWLQEELNNDSQDQEASENWEVLVSQEDRDPLRTV
jgi:putative NIF3 family GTP cyclohydrolase 1 type 2